MKSKSSGIIQLVLSILIIFLIKSFYFKVLSLIGLHFSGLAYTIANFIRYLLICLIVFVIYKGNINSGKRHFNKSFLNNFIYCVSCFVFLLVITIVLHELLNYIGNPRGIAIDYNFHNYFKQKFTIDSALNLVVDAVFNPFLLCVVFPLGFANIFKKGTTASMLAGLTYGVIYAIGLNANFEYAIMQAITPTVIVIMLTYLYKNNQNIWSVILTYICYVLFGVFAINYIL